MPSTGNWITCCHCFLDHRHAVKQYWTNGDRGKVDLTESTHKLTAKNWHRWWRLQDDTWCCFFICVCRREFLFGNVEPILLGDQKFVFKFHINQVTIFRDVVILNLTPNVTFRHRDPEGTSLAENTHFQPLTVLTVLVIHQSRMTAWCYKYTKTNYVFAPPTALIRTILACGVAPRCVFKFECQNYRSINFAQRALLLPNALSMRQFA